MSLNKQQWGEFWAIGGKPKDLIPLALSLNNWGGIALPPKDHDDYDPLTDTEGYLSLGSPDDFIYILATTEKYVRARAKCFVSNWPYNYKGKSGKIPWRLALTKARNELSSIKISGFLDGKEI